MHENADHPTPFMSVNIYVYTVTDMLSGKN